MVAGKQQILQVCTSIKTCFKIEVNGSILHQEYQCNMSKKSANKILNFYIQNVVDQSLTALKEGLFTGW